MFLKRLEIAGFKSFADPVVLHFEPGISCIVGPNGCGKSNVVDGLRWALGEQSAKSLRGDKIADVIFSGAVDRHRMKKARVELFFDNLDGQLPSPLNMVSIGRLLTTDPQSIYTLNGEQVRLADIKKFLMDTGIGRDGYSIISQGEVQSLVLANSRQRRLVLEEASGISKYQFNKDVTLKKIDQTKEDLLRLRDLLKEIESRLVPLREQSAKAKTYIESREKLTCYKKESLFHEAFFHHDQLEKYSGQIARLNSMIQAGEVTLAELHQKLSHARDLESQSQKELRQKREDLENLIASEGRLLQKKRELELSETRLKSQGEEREKLLAHHSTQLQQITAEQLKLIDLKVSNGQELARLERELGGVKGRLGELDGLLDGGKGRSEGQSKIYQGFQDLGFIQEKIDDNSRNLQFLIKERQLLLLDIQKLKSTLDQLEVEVAELTTDLTRRRDELQKLGVEVAGLEKEVDRGDKEREEIDYEINMVRGEIRSTKTRMDMVSTLSTGNLSHGGAAEVLKIRDTDPQKYKGIFGLVSQLLEVPPKYGLAFEMLLSGSLQNVVVEGADLAKMLIAELKKFNLGRAQFIPMDLIRIPSRVPLKDGAFRGLMGRGIELVKFEARFTGVFELLLGNTLVFEHIDHAVTFKKGVGGGFKLATLEGDIIVPSGIMSGGGKGRNHLEGVFGARGNPQELQRELAKFEKELLDLAREKADLEKKLAVAKKEHHEKSVRLSQGQYELQHAQRTIEEKTRRIRQHQEEIHGARLALQDRELKIQQQEQVVAEESGRLQAFKSLLDQKRLDQAETDRGFEDQLKRRESLFAEFKQLETRQAVIAERVAKFQTDHEGLENQAQGLREALEKEHQRAGKASENLKSITAHLSELAREEGEVAGKIAGVRREMETYTQSSVQEKSLGGELELQLSNSNDNLTKLRGELKDGELKLTRVENSLENVRAKLQEEFAIFLPANPRDYQFSFTSGLSYGELGGEVKRLAKVLEDLGTVNLLSIEELERTTERYNFTQSQIDDLERAMNLLLETIKEINQNCERQLKQTFAEVKIHFTSLFQTLFEGGEARLEWCDPENILESGIEFFCSPPGKTEKGTTLLSGGEKAFVTIAFLFSILRVRPPAFCILDEVDAALDGVNQVRFTRLLKNFTEGANPVQFLVITHKHETMKAADRLYGITMEQHGVSRLVTVNLEEWAADESNDVEVAGNRTEEAG